MVDERNRTIMHQMANKSELRLRLVLYKAINQIYPETKMKGRKYVNRSMDNDRAFNRLSGQCIGRS